MHSKQSAGHVMHVSPISGWQNPVPHWLQVPQSCGQLVHDSVD
jgi:hypothetical protein